MLEDGEIYSHGFVVRLRVTDEARVTALSRLREHLHYGDGRRWKRCREGLCMGGSGWLTGKRPGDKTVISKLNRREKLLLHNLAIVERDDGLFLDLEGVRRKDCKKLMEAVLGLDSEDWLVAYFRRLERYIVLSQPEAERLAAALGGVLHREKGRRARIVWRLHDLIFPVTIRTRAKSVAHLKIYRVQPERGATAAYRVEAWLEGDRNGRTEFFEKDEAVLDALLARLVDEHDLHPIERPAIWEGEGARTPEFEPRDAELRKLPMRVYRGWRPHSAKCHPPRGGDRGPRLVLGGPGPRISAGQRISCPNPLSTPSTPTPTSFSPGPCTPGERSLAHRITRDQVGLLSEIVIDGDHDPTPLLRHLVHELGGPGNVAVGYVGIEDSWHGIHRLMEELPEVTDDEMCMVVFVEPDVISAAIEDTWTRPDGSVDVDVLLTDLAAHARYRRYPTFSGILAEALRDLRALCERTGLRAVFVTTDYRSDYAEGGRASWYRGEGAIVRSTIGNAGRYWMHTRYRIENDRIVMLKDERHGRPGTIVWQREAPAPTWMGDEQLDPLEAEDDVAPVEFETGLGVETAEIVVHEANGAHDPAKNGGLGLRVRTTDGEGGGAAGSAPGARATRTAFGAQPHPAARRLLEERGPPPAACEPGQ